MEKLIKVEGVPGLYKDARRGTFINRNETEIETARQQKLSRSNKKLEERALKEKVDELSLQLNRIESMFQQLLEK